MTDPDCASLSVHFERFIADWKPEPGMESNSSHAAIEDNMFALGLGWAEQDPQPIGQIAEAMEEAKDLLQLAPAEGFVFSREEIVTKIDRDERLKQVGNIKMSRATRRKLKKNSNHGMSRLVGRPIMATAGFQPASSNVRYPTQTRSAPKPGAISAFARNYRRIACVSCQRDARQHPQKPFDHRA